MPIDTTRLAPWSHRLPPMSEKHQAILSKFTNPETGLECRVMVGECVEWWYPYHTTLLVQLQEGSPPYNPMASGYITAMPGNCGTAVIFRPAILSVGKDLALSILQLLELAALLRGYTLLLATDISGGAIHRNAEALGWKEVRSFINERSRRRVYLYEKIMKEKVDAF